MSPASLRPPDPSCPRPLPVQTQHRHRDHVDACAVEREPSRQRHPSTKPVRIRHAVAQGLNAYTSCSIRCSGVVYGSTTACVPHDGGRKQWTCDTGTGVGRRSARGGRSACDALQTKSGQTAALVSWLYGLASLGPSRSSRRAVQRDRGPPLCVELRGTAIAPECPSKARRTSQTPSKIM